MSAVQINSLEPVRLYMVDSLVPVAGKPGLTTFTVFLTKPGGAEAIVSRTITEKGHGWYELQPAAGDRDALGQNSWTVVAAGALDLPIVEDVIPAPVPAETLPAAFTDYWQNITWVPPGTTLLLPADVTGKHFIGMGGAIVDFNGRDISAARFAGLLLQGEGIVTGVPATFEDCTVLGDNAIGPFHAWRTGFQGTTTLSNSVNYAYRMIDCMAAPVNDEFPRFDFSLCTARTRIQSRRWSGGFQTDGMKRYGVVLNDRDNALFDVVTGGSARIHNMVDGSVTMRSAGSAGIIVEPTCTGGLVIAIGNVGTITNNSVGGGTTINRTEALITNIYDEMLFADTPLPELPGAPPADATLTEKVTWLYMYLRNRVTQSGSERTLYASDDVTAIAVEGTSDVAGLFDKERAV